MAVLSIAPGVPARSIHFFGSCDPGAQVCACSGLPLGITGKVEKI